MARPYQKANIPGPEMGTSVSDPMVMANLLKSPKKKVFVIGAESLNWELEGKKVADYFIEIANKIDCHVVATGHSNIYLKDKIQDGKLYEVRTVDIDKYSHPNARFSLPNLSDDDWKIFLVNLIEKL